MKEVLRAFGLTVNDARRVAVLPTKTSPPEGFAADLQTGGTLWGHQIEALWQLKANGGLIGFIGVGKGKTLIAALAPTVLGISATEALLLLPARLEKEYHRQVKKHEGLFRLSPPPVLRYSSLSRPDGIKALEKARPKLLILDEAHRIARPDSARGRRLLRYLSEHPETGLLAMSGTLIQRSIKDIHTFCRYALGLGSPLPLHYGDVESWSAILDPGGRWPGPDDYQCFLPVAWWYEKSTGDPQPKGRGFAVSQAFFRRAFLHRVTTAPGVVVTEKSSCDASLYFRLRSQRVSAKVKAALAELEATWTLPDGTELVDTLELDRAQRQLSSGYFYRWRWPNGVDLVWLARRKAWSSELRARLSKNLAFADSPALIIKAIEEGRLESRAWGPWAEIRDRVKPATETVWVDLEWFSSLLSKIDLTPDTIIWYGTRAESEAVRRFVETPSDDVSSSRRPLALSVKRHATGLNLQPWSRNYILSPSSSAAHWEQLIGRTHREGQEADEVWFEIWIHTPYLKRAWSRAKEGASLLSQKLTLGVVI